MRPFPYWFEILKRDKAEPFGGVWRDVGKQVVQVPHFLDEVRLCKHPTAPEPAQSVCFRQTVCDDEFLAEMG